MNFNRERHTTRTILFSVNDLSWSAASVGCCLLSNVLTSDKRNWLNYWQTSRICPNNCSIYNEKMHGRSQTLYCWHYDVFTILMLKDIYIQMIAVLYFHMKTISLYFNSVHLNLLLFPCRFCNIATLGKLSIVEAKMALTVITARKAGNEEVNVNKAHQWLTSKSGLCSVVYSII